MERNFKDLVGDSKTSDVVRPIAEFSSVRDAVIKILVPVIPLQENKLKETQVEKATD